MTFPSQGTPRDELLATLRSFRQLDTPWREGRLFAGVYDPGPELEATIKAAYAEFLSENALYPNYFPSLLALENEVVRAMAELLRGDDQVVGNCTSGGTESILLAVKTARDLARAVRPGVTGPELVLPRTAHPAFHKACHYLGASAPCYSHGVIDPVEAIGALALERGLPLHVDACVGGIHLSIMRRAGLPVPAFDLSVPGVSTISVDLHKYGYAAKNVSALLYRNRALRRYALFASAATTGYAVINTTVLSSRSGGPLAGAWAALNALGETGYQRIVGEVMEAAQRVIAGVCEIPGLRVLGAPDMCMLAIASDELNVFELDDALARRGWALQPQFSVAGCPANLHLSINRSNVAQVDALLADLRSAAEEVRANGSSLSDAGQLRTEVLQLMQTPGPETFGQVAALAGLTPGEMPSSFARINTVLDALPDPIVEMLLIEYLNSIYA
jgi:sphinganine-1-phosphate aldolase